MPILGIELYEISGQAPNNHQSQLTEDLLMSTLQYE